MLTWNAQIKFMANLFKKAWDSSYIEISLEMTEWF